MMNNNNTEIALPPSETQEPKALLAEVVAVEILQDNFASNADREEFAQAVKMHGVTFLCLANSPLPKPSSYDMSVMNKLGRSLSSFWSQALVVGGCHD